MYSVAKGFLPRAPKTPQSLQEKSRHPPKHKMERLIKTNWKFSGWEGSHPHANVPHFCTQPGPSPSRKPFNCFWRGPKSITTFASYLSARKTRENISGTRRPLIIVPELFFLQSLGLIRLYGLTWLQCAKYRNRSKGLRRCGFGNSRVAWHVSPKHFLSLANRSGDRGRNMPQMVTKQKYLIAS